MDYICSRKMTLLRQNTVPIGEKAIFDELRAVRAKMFAVHRSASELSLVEEALADYQEWLRDMGNRLQKNRDLAEYKSAARWL